MTSASSPTPPLAADTPCVRCSYNLRSLEAAGNCPECGLAIARSLAIGQELHDSRPGWIATLAWATRLLLAAQLMPALLVILGMAWSSLINLWTGYIPFPVVASAVGLLATLIHAVGCFLLTRPENPYALRQPLRRRALLLRLFCLGPVLACGIALFVSLNRNRYWDLSPLIAFATLAAGFIPCPLLQFLFLRRLARRVLDEGLAEHSAIVACGYSISTASLFLLPFAPSVNNSIIMPLGVLTALILFWLWSMLLFGLFTCAFGRAARSARIAWQSADAATPPA